ncbi:hypothetical protein SO694_00078071 [Aureococcus anophagefferens]|uniref:Uncharacterized protein n=1 Tax=Aureococcus anophagefferens TaxID=44056 RepID=A0ABR1FH12_AURAN
MGFEERSPERGEAPVRRALRRSASLPELRARPASPGADRGGPCPASRRRRSAATATSSTATTQFRLAIPGVDDVVYGVDVRRDDAPRRALAEAPPRRWRRRPRFSDDGGEALGPRLRALSATPLGAPGGGGVTVALAMGAVRVVATPFEKFAQYELRVSTDGGPPKSAWRRYSVRVHGLPRGRVRAARIVRTLSAWADAQDAKKVFRCTHPAYLVRRYYHFEHAAKRRARSDDAARAAPHAGRPAAAPFARSTDRAIPGALPSDAASDAVSAAGTPAPRSSFLGAFLGVRDVKRVPVPSS